MDNRTFKTLEKMGNTLRAELSLDQLVACEMTYKQIWNNPMLTREQIQLIAIRFLTEG